MSSCLVRRGTFIAAFGAAALLTACGEDARVEAVDTGISRDSVISVLAKDAPRAAGDSMPNVYWRETYLIAGQNYEVLYFHPDGEKVKTAADTVYTDLTPVVMVDNRMVGKGWTFWDSVSTANGIPLKQRG